MLALHLAPSLDVVEQQEDLGIQQAVGTVKLCAQHETAPLAPCATGPELEDSSIPFHALLRTSKGHRPAAGERHKAPVAGRPRCHQPVTEEHIQQTERHVPGHLRVWPL